MQRFFSADALLEHYHHIERERPDLDYDIDGVVTRSTGSICRPGSASARGQSRWATAHKFPAEQLSRV